MYGFLSFLVDNIENISQNLAPLALDLGANSSTHIRIKIEVSYNFCKEITRIPTLTKVAWYSTFKLRNLFVSPAMILNLELPFKTST